MNTFNLEIACPYYELFNGNVISITFMSHDGEVSILKSHSHEILIMDSGTLQFTLPTGEKKIAFVSEGIVTVKEGVLVLSESTEFKENIEVERALEAKKRAELHIAEAMSSYSIIRAKKSLQRAKARLSTAQK